jgi:carboxypeptidase Taq
MTVVVERDLESRLWDRARSICRLRAAASLLAWDQYTALPAAAAAARVEQIGEFETVLTEHLGAPEVTELLDALDGCGTPDGAALVRVLRREHDKARLVPAPLRAALTEAASAGLNAWGRAREEGRFDRFTPALERLVELRRRYAACFDGVAEPYDVCLDDFDPGALMADIAPTLEALRAPLVALADEVRERPPAPGPRGPFPVARQLELVRGLLTNLGLELDRARIAEAPHALTLAIHRDDVGLALRFRPEDLSGVWLALHELGHARYEQGIDPALAGTPLAQAVSASFHEAQARVYEHHVGRHPRFLRALARRLDAAFGGVRAEELEAQFRSPRFSAVRLDADELTYGLHIMIRTDLERALINGELDVGELPAAWAARYAADLGVEIENERDGVLQDVQWAVGAFGYFPTYLLGAVIAAMLWERIEAEVPELEAELAAGRADAAGAWLHARVWSLGRRLPAAAVLRGATGRSLTVEPYLAHLRRRFT